MPNDPVGPNNKRGVSYALSADAREAIQCIADATGLSKASAIELAVRLVARIDAADLSTALLRLEREPVAPPKKSTPKPRAKP